MHSDIKVINAVGWNSTLINRATSTNLNGFQIKRLNLMKACLSIPGVNLIGGLFLLAVGIHCLIHPESQSDRLLGATMMTIGATHFFLGPIMLVVHSVASAVFAINYAVQQKRQIGVL